MVMEKKTGGRKKFFFAAAFILVCLCAGGCRLFRFLDAKDQLRDFAENFEVSDTDGLRLVFRNPVLLANDIDWLMVHSPPEIATADDGGRVWTYRLVKKYLGAGREKGNFDLFLEMRFNDGDRLSEVVFPRRLTKYLNAEIFGKIMNSMGDADISKLSKTGTGTVKSLRPADIPTSAEAEEVLGVPYLRLSAPDGYVYAYKYRLAERTPKGTHVVFKLFLSFDSRTSKLTRLELPLRSLKLKMNFRPSAAPGT